MGNQILLIDDDFDLLEAFEESLRLSGYSVITATSAKHGIELYDKNSPCIVFSDIQMPDMDGYELFLAIRKLDSNAKVILVTGHEDKEKSLIARKNGLLEIMIKPILPNDLEDRIKKNNC